MPARLTLTPLEDRLTPAAGDLDPAFGDGGVVRFPAYSEPGEFAPTQVAAGVDGGAVLVGSAPRPGSGPNDANGTAVRRLLADGRPDPAFAGGGLAFPPVQGVLDILVQPDGKVLLLGTASVARLNADGTPDAGFGADGVAAVAFGESNVALRALALRPDGRILAAGSVGPGQPTDAARPLAGYEAMAVAQLTADGRPDAGFGTNGATTVRYPVNGFDTARAAAVSVAADGSLALAGAVVVSESIQQTRFSGPFRLFGTEFAVALLTSDGRPDAGFGDAGRARAGAGAATAVLVRADGRVGVAGTSGSAPTPIGGAFGNAPAAALLTAAGALDPGYDGDGRADLPAAAGGGFGVTLARFLPDGRVVFVPGDLALLAADGRPDPALGGDGRVPLPAPSRFGGLPTDTTTTYGFAVRPDGDVVVVGLVNTSAVPGEAAVSVPVAFVVDGTGPVGFTGSVPSPLQVGTGSGGRVVTLAASAAGYAPAGTSSPYPGFTGGVRTASGDVNGDGVADLVTGPGPTGGPNVVVTDGKTGLRLVDLDAFETGYTGGVFVAAADLNGDGRAEVVVTPDVGGGPVVVIYDGARLSAGLDERAEAARFYGIEDPNFRGGARPAVGDVNGDGRADLVVAAGFGGGPRVAVFDGAAVLAGPPGGLPRKLVPDFFALEPAVRNGVFVAAGDLNGDGRAEVVVGGGPGGGPRVTALDGAGVAAGRISQVANFFAGDEADRGGVRVAVRTGLDGTPQLVTGSGSNSPGRVRVYKAVTALAGGAADQVVSPFGDEVMADGVYVG